MTAFNPQAYPCLDHSGYGGGLSMRDPGLTMLEYFAAAALPAVIAATSAGQHTPGAKLEGATVDERIAHDAFAIARAMLVEAEVWRIGPSGEENGNG